MFCEILVVFEVELARHPFVYEIQVFAYLSFIKNFFSFLVFFWNKNLGKCLQYFFR